MIPGDDSLWLRSHAWPRLGSRGGYASPASSLTKTRSMFMPTRPSVGVSINLISSSLRSRASAKLKRLLSRVSLDDAQDVRAAPHAEADRVDHLRSPGREPLGQRIRPMAARPPRSSAGRRKTSRSRCILRRDGRDDHFLPNSGKKRETLEINS